MTTNYRIDIEAPTLETADASAHVVYALAVSYEQLSRRAR